MTQRRPSRLQLSQVADLLKSKSSGGATVTADIREWLEGLGLGKYAQVFVDSEIDLEILPHLSDEDLKELGLPPRAILGGGL